LHEGTRLHRYARAESALKMLAVGAAASSTPLRAPGTRMEASRERPSPSLTAGSSDDPRPRRVLGVWTYSAPFSAAPHPLPSRHGPDQDHAVGVFGELARDGAPRDCRGTRPDATSGTASTQGPRPEAAVHLRVQGRGITIHTGQDRTCRIQLAGLRGIRQYPRSWAQGGRGAVIGDPAHGWDGRESQ